MQKIQKTFEPKTADVGGETHTVIVPDTSEYGQKKWEKLFVEATAEYIKHHPFSDACKRDKRFLLEFDSLMAKAGKDEKKVKALEERKERTLKRRKDGYEVDPSLGIRGQWDASTRAENPLGDLAPFEKAAVAMLKALGNLDPSFEEIKEECEAQRKAAIARHKRKK